jgi:hypothetical protein
MDQTFPSSTRTTCTNYNTILRLQELLLSENSKISSSKRTHHINDRYFFAADRFKKGEVKVAYCPTMNMLADFFTKLLQGSTFKKNAKQEQTEKEKNTKHEQTQETTKK